MTHCCIVMLEEHCSYFCIHSFDDQQKEILYMVHYGFELTYLDANILYNKARQMPPFPHVYFPYLHLSLFIYMGSFLPSSLPLCFLLLFPTMHL